MRRAESYAKVLGNLGSLAAALLALGGILLFGKPLAAPSQPPPSVAPKLPDPAPSGRASARAYHWQATATSFT